MEKVKIKHKTLKIKIYPTNKQKKVLNEWSNTFRYIANVTIEKREKDKEENNFYDLRNKIVTAKNVPEDMKWQLKVPKEIRANAVKEVVSNYKTAFSLLKNKKIKYFKMKYRKKKKDHRYLILSKSGVSKIDNTHIKIHPRTFGKNPLKIRKDKAFKNVTKLLDGIKVRNNYIFLPVEIEVQNHTRAKYDICALDPGVKTFQTMFSNEEVIKFGDQSKILKMYELIDYYKSIQTKVKKYLKNKLRKRILFLNEKIKNKVNEIHWKTINYLTNNYNNILLPEFETQKMTNNLHRKVNRKMMFWSHYKFKQRLIWKCNLKNRNIKIVNESYTSKTCTNCGWLNHNLSNKDCFKCNKCCIEIDRDTNGARNILLKELAGYES